MAAPSCVWVSLTPRPVLPQIGWASRLSHSLTSPSHPPGFSSSEGTTGLLSVAPRPQPWACVTSLVPSLSRAAHPPLPAACASLGPRGPEEAQKDSPFSSTPCSQRSLHPQAPPCPLLPAALPLPEDASPEPRPGAGVLCFLAPSLQLRIRQPSLPTGLEDTDRAQHTAGA